MTGKDLTKQEERINAWELIRYEYPEIMDDLEQYDEKDKKIMFSSILTKAVAAKLDIPIAGITLLGGKPYVNKTGLLYRVQKDPRKVKSIKAYPVLYAHKINVLKQSFDAEEYKYFIGYSEDGTAIYKGVVEFDDGSIFIDEGTANAKYLTPQYNKMSTMIPYVNELASTRATNRAMRLATGIGLVSIEEVNQVGKDIVRDKIRPITESQKKLIFEIQKVYEDLGMNEAKIIAAQSKYGSSNIDEIPEESLKELLAEMVTILGNKDDESETKGNVNEKH